MVLYIAHSTINDQKLAQDQEQALNPVLAGMMDIVRKIQVGENEYELYLPGSNQKNFTRKPDERELHARRILANAIMLSPTILWCALYPGRLHHIRGQDCLAMELDVPVEKLVRETALLPHCVQCAIRDGAVVTNQSDDEKDGRKILQVQDKDTCVCASTTVQHICWPCSLEAIQKRHLEFAGRRTINYVSDGQARSKHSLTRCECGNIEIPPHVEFVRKCAGCGGFKTSPFKNFAGHIVEFKAAAVDVEGYFDAKSGRQIGRVGSDGSTVGRHLLFQEEKDEIIIDRRQLTPTANSADNHLMKKNLDDVAQKRKQKRRAEDTQSPSPKHIKANPPFTTTAPDSDGYTHIPVFTDDAIQGLCRLNLRVRQFYRHKRKDIHPKDRLTCVLEVNREALLDEQARANVLEYCRTSAVMSRRLQDFANSVSSNGQMTGAEFLNLLNNPDAMAAFLAADDAVALFPAHMLAGLRKMGFELRPMYYSTRFQNLAWVRFLVALAKNRGKFFQKEVELLEFLKLCGFSDGMATSVVSWIREEIPMPTSVSQINDLCRMQSEGDTSAAWSEDKREKGAVSQVGETCQAAKRGRIMVPASISNLEKNSVAMSSPTKVCSEFVGEDGMGH
ncbi:MAG: hypothetical protein FE78DRAFT_67280 [Acidomyces sp. 'richmondensis']|nr:MAG: hypothetical protein FE78DRAFT_67280 [Acidomyces sp. 'richmondensis']